MKLKIEIIDLIRSEIRLIKIYLTSNKTIQTTNFFHKNLTINIITYKILSIFRIILNYNQLLKGMAFIINETYINFV